MLTDITNAVDKTIDHRKIQDNKSVYSAREVQVFEDIVAEVSDQDNEAVESALVVFVEDFQVVRHAHHAYSAHRVRFFVDSVFEVRHFVLDDEDLNGSIGYNQFKFRFAYLAEYYPFSTRTVHISSDFA